MDTDWTEAFFLDLVTRLRHAGVRCAVTGGLACIEFGIVEHTVVCDLLTDPSASATMLHNLASVELEGARCRYRGTMSAPLAASWLAGGWTSHFEWPQGAETAYLDVFGSPPRVRAPWWSEEAPPYATRPVVAAMKRTQRPKDWSQATALGLQLLAQEDPRGWLHLFDAEAMRNALQHRRPPDQLVTMRPSLQMALDSGPLLERVIQTEIDFWSRLARLRLGVFLKAAGPYAARTRALRGLGEMDLLEDHEKRLGHAEACLPTDPLSDYGRERLIDEARSQAALGLNPAVMTFLPRVGPNFDYQEET